ncbi:hypothetical protein F4553_006427 [Allocatelliglobosispora scoriae]|uniref:Uncharacterized protein n=1 Tax=Allocatelliglobosispora scoriae TaxID=643052 RepID=A0A841C1H1_9ACTN|nr:hypothetical protein [Allocatelliglobosispora scoriae]MBB5872993.1 hypothetical protein [Allocatelliglobosispora scoriae]
MLTAIFRQVRPVTGQQRLLWWSGALLLASAVVHTVVAIVDGGPWLGAVSWRKPVVFGFSFGVLLWSAVWIMRNLSDRWFGWLPAGLLGGASLLEVSLITMQRWRGVPSHFNADTTLDDNVFSVMGMSVVVVVLAVVWLLVWALVRFRGSPAARLAAVAGLLAVLASGVIGKDMIAEGEAVVAATGHVPAGVVFGVEGSAKLAHAVAMHGLQLLIALAIGLRLGRRSSRSQTGIMLLAIGGYGALLTSVTVTAYAGRSVTDPQPPMALLGAAGVIVVAACLAVTAAAWVRRPVLAEPAAA